VPSVTDRLLEAAKALWVELSLAPVSFARAEQAGAPDVAVGPRSRLCPPGWAGLVVLGEACIATAPDTPSADLVRRALAGLPVASLVETAALRERLTIAEELGPATLAYLAKTDFRPAGPLPEGATVVTRSAGDEEVLQLLASVSEEDADEAGIEYTTSPVFLVLVDGAPAAACGYRAWLGRAAHFGVLTAHTRRGRGLARAAATHAVAHALDSGLMPQWRARPDASRAVARALGFRELGAQISFRLER
jgi:RimJ/RimL family protein N-acetyltransferase